MWGYLSQFLQYGAALLILPLLLRKLTSAELGVWYVFMTIAALVSMLDMGFTPTVARNVSYVFGGAKCLRKDGYEVVGQLAEVDFGLLRVMTAASRRIFFMIAALAFVLLSIPGTAYILHVAKGAVAQQNLLWAWGIFVSATVLNLYFKYYTPLLQGRGLFSAFYKSSALANLAFVAVTGVLLQAGLGLPAVALGYLVAALIGRWLSWKYYYDGAFRAQLASAPPADTTVKEISNVMWHNSWRLGLGVIGAFMILRANILISSAYLGLPTTAAYALSLQVFSMLQSMSTVVFNVQLPKIAQYRVSNQREALIRTMEMGFGSSLGLFAIGTVTLLLIGGSMIHWIGGRTELLSSALLAWIGLMMLLELNHSLAAGVIVTGNEVPFVIPALLSGAAIVIASWIGLKYGSFGIAWLIGCQFTVQLAYNNWKWPWVIYREYYSA